MKQKSPMLRLWELGEEQQGGLKRAILSAVAGVLFGMLPYFAAAQIMLGPPMSMFSMASANVQFGFEIVCSNG